MSRRLTSQLLLLIAPVVFCACAEAASDAQPEDKGALRCGWFKNPTSGNASLTDRDGIWVIGEQGGHQADGDWPQFLPRDWITTNRSYGYGCACLRVIADQTTHEVTRILAAKALSLDVCRRDRPSTAKPTKS